MSRRALVPLLLVPLLLVGAAACFSEEPDTSAPGGDDVVVIEMTSALTFQPQHVQVRAGQTVRWRNASNVPHTATADASLASSAANVELPAGAQPWHSGTIAPGASYDRVLSVTGDYRYFCDPHELAAMVGTIEVVP